MGVKCGGAAKLRAQRGTATRQSFAGRGGSLGERPREVQGSKECENDVNVSGRVQGMCARDGDTEMRLKGLFGQAKSVAGLK